MSFGCELGFFKIFERVAEFIYFRAAPVCGVIHLALVPRLVGMIERTTSTRHDGLALRRLGLIGAFVLLNGFH